MEEAFQLLCESWDAGMLVNMAFAKAAYPFALERFLGWQQNRMRDVVRNLEKNDSERAL